MQPVARALVVVIVAACAGHGPGGGRGGEGSGGSAQTAPAVPPADAATAADPGGAVDAASPDAALVAGADAAPAIVAKQRACGRRKGQTIVKVKSHYISDNAACNKIATAWANAPHEDRVCATDADCTLVVGDGNCQYMAIATKASSKKNYARAPCGNPASGACRGGETAACVDGCCMLGGGRGEFGTGEVVYPKPELP